MDLKTITVGKQLRADAAASYARMRAAGMPSGVTSAYRSAERQQELYEAYKAGKGNYAVTPDKSNHVKGIALDLPVAAANWVRTHGKRFGWSPVKNEKWHFDYNAKNDVVHAELVRKHRAAAQRKVKAIQRTLGVPATGHGDSKTQAAWDKLTAAAK